MRVQVNVPSDAVNSWKLFNGKIIEVMQSKNALGSYDVIKTEHNKSVLLGDGYWTESHYKRGDLQIYKVYTALLDTNNMDAAQRLLRRD